MSIKCLNGCVCACCKTRTHTYVDIDKVHSRSHCGLVPASSQKLYMLVGPTRMQNSDSDVYYNLTHGVVNLFLILFLLRRPFVHVRRITSTCPLFPFLSDPTSLPHPFLQVYDSSLKVIHAAHLVYLQGHVYTAI